MTSTMKVLIVLVHVLTIVLLLYQKFGLEQKQREKMANKEPDGSIRPLGNMFLKVSLICWTCVTEQPALTDWSTHRR